MNRTWREVSGDITFVIVMTAMLYQDVNPWWGLVVAVSWSLIVRMFVVLIWGTDDT